MSGSSINLHDVSVAAFPGGFRTLAGLIDVPLITSRTPKERRHGR